MYKYETHLHTSPVSLCARVGVRENLEFYKSRGYDGVFITNHFIDGNMRISADATYAEKIEYNFSDYEEAKRLSSEIGIKVFFGVETSYAGTDFLIYGLDKVWFLSYPEIMDMRKSQQLEFFKSEGALVIQAHPFREAGYIDHIRLFPRNVHGVEVINACRTDFVNQMADKYADAYGLLKTAGTDNHFGGDIHALAGMASETPLNSEQDFIKAVFDGTLEIFHEKL